MPSAIDIKLFGDKELERRFAKLTDARQTTIMAQELEKSAKRLKKKMVAKVAGFTKDDTPDEQKSHSNRLIDALKVTKVTRSRLSRTEPRGFISSVNLAPERSALGLPPKYPWFYPWSLEYGYTRTGRNPVVVPPQSWIRSTMNENKAAEISKIARSISKKIEKAFRTGKGVR